MSKHKKKRGNKADPASYINLITAILQLITSILLIYEAMK